MLKSEGPSAKPKFQQKGFRTDGGGAVFDFDRRGTQAGERSKLD